MTPSRPLGAKDRAIVKRIRNSGHQDYATFFMKARRERVETRRTFTNNAGSERLPRHDENTFAVRLDSPSPNTPQLATGSFIPDDCARRHRARSAASKAKIHTDRVSLQAAALEYGSDIGLTLALSCCREQQRRRSGGCTQSATGRC